MSNNLPRIIFRSFKSRGLAISGDASSALANVLSREDDITEALSAVLDEINGQIERREISSSVIDLKIITDIVANISSSEDDMAQESLQLLDSFTCPRLEYDEKQKTYRLDRNPTYTLHGSIDTRAHMYRERLQLVLQRVLRLGVFTTKKMISKSSSNMDGTSGCHEISTIQSLLGSQGVAVLVGILTQPYEGVWHLEDLGAVIALDLSKANSFPMLTEGSIVIAEGRLVNSVFVVTVIGAPNAEDRLKTIASIGVHDVFGNNTPPKKLQQQLDMEQEAVDCMIVFISDIQLDKPEVSEKLQRVFQGFEDAGCTPIFVLMGPFTTKSWKAADGRGHVTAIFSTLADLICSCSRLQQHSKFVIVPGSGDVGSGSALPRRGVPELFTKELRRRVPHVSFPSNPCRLRFYTQEIVIFREDLLQRMQRHLVAPCLHNQSSASSSSSSQLQSQIFSQSQGQVADTPQQLAMALCDQGHLCPLPQHARPVHWELDHAMRLFPLPTLLVLGDHSDQYVVDYKDCQTVNPGSFSCDYSFVVYRPSTREVELSKLS